MFYFLIIFLLSLCNIILGAVCKAEMFFVAAVVFIGFGSLVSFFFDTKIQNVLCVLSSAFYLGIGAYSIFQHNLYGAYCADFAIIAAQMFIIAIYTLLMTKRKVDLNESEK